MPPYNYCAVDGCKSQKNNRSLSFFSLPVNEVRRKRWLQVIGRPDLDHPKTNPKCYFVCSLHFEKYMITSKPILRLDAEPIKFLPNQPNHYDNEECKDAATQTECYINGESVFNDLHAFPKLSSVKQEKIQNETIFKSETQNIDIMVPTIKLEYVDNSSKPKTGTQEENIQTEHHIPVPAKKIRGKTRKPRKARKIKPREDIKEPENIKQSTS